MPQALPAHHRPANGLPQAVAVRRNRRMTDILRRATAVRGKRERDRSSQDQPSIA
jgi:hypothetical protein